MLTASSASSKAGGMYVYFPVEGKRPHTAEQCVGLRGGSDARSGSSVRHHVQHGAKRGRLLQQPGIVAVHSVQDKPARQGGSS